MFLHSKIICLLIATRILWIMDTLDVDGHRTLKELLDVDIVISW